jgi:hypothetical protein
LKRTLCSSKSSGFVSDQVQWHRCSGTGTATYITISVFYCHFFLPDFDRPC